MSTNVRARLARLAVLALGVLLCATLVGLFFFAQVWVQSPEIVTRGGVARVLWTQLAYHWMWAPLLPAVAWLAARWPLPSPDWKRRLALHGLAGLFLSAVEVVGGISLLWLLGYTSRPSWAQSVQHGLINLPIAYPVYWVLLLLLLIVRSTREREWHELHEVSLRSKLFEARLAALRAQMDPHFIFNSLHSLSGVMRRKPQVAAHALRELGQLILLTFEANQRNEIRLAEELDLLKRYLLIERLRFGDRLNFIVEVPPEVLEGAVPPFVLQPLVENALTHGVGHSSRGGTVMVRVRHERESLDLEVRDDGRGAQPQGLIEGVGLKNTRERITQLYGNAGQLTVTSSPGEGFLVNIRIPFRVWQQDAFAL